MSKAELTSCKPYASPLKPALFLNLSVLHQWHHNSLSLQSPLLVMCPLVHYGTELFPGGAKIRIWPEKLRKKKSATTKIKQLMKNSLNIKTSPIYYHGLRIQSLKWVQCKNISKLVIVLCRKKISPTVCSQHRWLLWIPKCVGITPHQQVSN